MTKKQKFIPSEWSQTLAGEIFSFVRTHAFSRENLTNGISFNGNVGNIHYGDIHSTYNSLKINLDDTPIPIVNDKSFSPSKEDLLIDGDLVMADASEDYEGVGVTVLVDGLKGKKVVGGLHTFVLRDEKGVTNKYYRQYIFRNPEVRNKLQKVANGVSVYGVSKREVSKILLTIPPAKEQGEIVKILETWDEYLDKLSKKIEIKKSIKRGLMQKLLNGEVRLKGFNNKWKKVELGDVIKFVNGYAFKSSEYVDDGLFRVITIGNVNNGIMLLEKVKKVNKIPNDINDEQILNIGDILISMTGNVGRICFVNSDNCLLNQRVGKIIPKGIDKNFLYHKLRYNHFIYQMIQFAQGGAQDNIGVKDIKKYKMFCPDINEQKAISTILSGADNEISLLEKKVKIIKNQKKYLLNNLITGKIRLPEFQKVK